MADTTLPGVLLKGVAASRPAASAVAKGTVYSATDTGAITQSDGSSWSTWATISSGLADPMTTRGDVIIRNASNTTARLGIGSSGKVLSSDGTDISWQTPASGGGELGYVEFTSDVSITATTEGTAQTVVSAGAVTFDGSPVIIEFSCMGVKIDDVTRWVYILLFDGSTDLGGMGYVGFVASNSYRPVLCHRRLTPSAGSHTFSIRGYGAAGTQVFAAGAGGTGPTNMPGFIRVTKV